MSEKALTLPAELRERLAADYQPVHTLRAPWLRTLIVVPVALVALVAAPVVFNVRSDGEQLGWVGVWGMSLIQFVLGLLVVAAALRESIPGRGWSNLAIAVWLAIPLSAVVAVTFISWDISQVTLRREWWRIGVMCLGGSAAMALPIVALAAVLIARAYPTRPAIAGALLGAGAGLIADAGWRTFCHFTEPEHVLSAHLAAVVMSTAIGAFIAARVCAPKPGTLAR